MADYTKAQPHPNSKLNRAQIGEIMGGPMAPDADNDDGMKSGSNCPDCASGNVANTSMETTNINGGRGVMVTHRHHETPRKKDDSYQEPVTHRHTFADHNSFANHFKGHFTHGSGPKQQSE